MVKKTRRKNNRRYSKKLSRKKYSKKRLSRKRKSRKKKSRKKYSKRKMRGGSQLQGEDDRRLAAGLAASLALPPGPARHTAPSTQKEEDSALAAGLAASLALPGPQPEPEPEPARTVRPAPAPQPEPEPEPARTVRPAPAPQPEDQDGTTLGIMRHSLRLDNELDKSDPNYKENQNYWKNGFNYNTPLANDINIDPHIEGVSLEDIATGRILLSIERGLRNRDFKCIITSPFTRCLQTAKIVGINLNIPPEKIFINYNLREDDTALALYKPIKYSVPDPVWNTLEPYDRELIAEIAKGGIEPYVEQTVNDIFNNYKHLGNVLLITHGDVYNKYGPTIPGTDIGATRLEEAGWAIFEPPDNEILSHAGEGFFERL